MNAYHHIKLLMALLAFTTHAALAQMSISGPTCVTHSTLYQYNIEGNWQTGDFAKVCIVGGTFSDGSVECGADSVISFVHVRWNEDASTGTITLTSTSGNANISVVICKRLHAGFIASGIKQDVAFSTRPDNIICAMPQGGSCATSYAMQWESSPDAAAWAPVTGATKQNFEFVGPLSNTAYYRRKTTEQTSGTVGYSDTAVVYVGPNLADHIR